MSSIAMKMAKLSVLILALIAVAAAATTNGELVVIDDRSFISTSSSAMAMSAMTAEVMAFEAGIDAAVAAAPAVPVLATTCAWPPHDLNYEGVASTTCDKIAEDKASEGTIPLKQKCEVKCNKGLDLRVVGGTGPKFYSCDVDPNTKGAVLSGKLQCLAVCDPLKADVLTKAGAVALPTSECLQSIASGQTCKLSCLPSGTTKAEDMILYGSRYTCNPDTMKMVGAQVCRTRDFVEAERKLYAGKRAERQVGRMAIKEAGRAAREKKEADERAALDAGEVVAIAAAIQANTPEGVAAAAAADAAAKAALALIPKLADPSAAAGKPSVTMRVEASFHKFEKFVNNTVDLVRRQVKAAREKLGDVKFQNSIREFIEKQSQGHAYSATLGLDVKAASGSTAGSITFDKTKAGKFAVVPIVKAYFGRADGATMRSGKVTYRTIFPPIAAAVEALLMVKSTWKPDDNGNDVCNNLPVKPRDQYDYAAMTVDDAGACFIKNDDVVGMYFNPAGLLG